MAQKYNQFGGLNPVWVAEEDRRLALEQDRELQEANANLIESIRNGFHDVIEAAAEAIRECYNENPKEEKEIILETNKVNNSISIEDELEAKFQFIKRHSDSDEDLALAKKILGID